MRHRKLIFSKVLIVVLLAAITTAAQDIHIRTRVDLVVVPVTVKGPDDQLASGLTKADFRIYENGKEQSISEFSIDPVPLSAAVLVDTGLGKSFEKIQKTLPALTGAFSPFDEVAVYRFDDYITKIVDFTSDKDLLSASITKLKAIESAPPAMAGVPFISASPIINGMPVAPSLQTSAGIPAPPKDIKVLHDAIYTAAGDLAKRPGERRRIVLVVSDGRAGGNEHTYDQTVTRLLENGIQVYSIGLDLAFLSRRFTAMDKYSKSTGGDSFFLNATDSLERAYFRAVEEARNQYVLAYFSTNEATGPLPIFREITIKMVPAGYKVIHRRGYYQYPR